jgi:hypothetical protein
MECSLESEHLPSIWEALGFIPSRKKKQGGGEVSIMLPHLCPLATTGLLTVTILSCFNVTKMQSCKMKPFEAAIFHLASCFGIHTSCISSSFFLITYYCSFICLVSNLKLTILSSMPAARAWIYMCVCVHACVCMCVCGGVVLGIKHRCAPS